MSPSTPAVGPLEGQGRLCSGRPDEEASASMAGRKRRHLTSPFGARHPVHCTGTIPHFSLKVTWGQSQVGTLKYGFPAHKAPMAPAYGPSPLLSPLDKDTRCGSLTPSHLWVCWSLQGRPASLLCCQVGAGPEASQAGVGVWWPPAQATGQQLGSVSIMSEHHAPGGLQATPRLVASRRRGQRKLTHRSRLRNISSHSQHVLLGNLLFKKLCSDFK